MSSDMPPPCSRPLPVAAPVILSTANTPTISVPNTPLNRWTGIAPTGSSILSASSSFTARTTRTPANKPMRSEALTVTNAQGAVIATRPASTPLIDMLRSGLPSQSQLTVVADRSPMNAAVLVVIKMCAIALGSAAIVDPGLKPNQPSHSTRHPMNADVKLCGGIGFTLPSAPNLPSRGPRMSTPASAAQPPMLCTTVEPAKSQKPADASQPPPQIQWPVIG